MLTLFSVTTCTCISHLGTIIQKNLRKTLKYTLSLYLLNSQQQILLLKSSLKIIKHNTYLNYDNKEVTCMLNLIK